MSDALYGVNVSSSRPREDSLSSAGGGTSPPGYMIKMVLVFLYGSRLPQGSDKSEWELPLEFQGLTFLVTDFRRYKWNIYGPEGSQEEARELKRKLITAANILNKQIENEAQTHFASDHLFIQNHYHKTLALYEYFYSEVRSQLEAPPNNKEGTEAERFDISEEMVHEIQRNIRIEFNLIATSIFFFALTEVLIDACFALGNRNGCSYKDFRKKDWAKRVKFFLKFSSDKTFAADYKDILEVRRYYRNIPIHASPEYFFPMKGFGLIPSNYRALQAPHMLPSIGFSQEEALRVLGLFDRFFGYFKASQVGKFAFIYVKSGLPIPIHSESAEKLKKFMSSEEKFKEEVQSRTDYQDMRDNMDI